MHGFNSIPRSRQVIIQWCHLVGKNHPRAHSKMCLSTAVRVTCRRQCQQSDVQSKVAADPQESAVSSR